MDLGWKMVAALWSLVVLIRGSESDTSQPQAFQSRMERDVAHRPTASQWVKICGIIVGVGLWMLRYRLQTWLLGNKLLNLEQDLCGVFPAPVATRKLAQSPSSRLPSPVAPVGIVIPETQIFAPTCGAGSGALTKSTHLVNRALVMKNAYNIGPSITPVAPHNRSGDSPSSPGIGPATRPRSVSSDGWLSWSHQIPKRNDRAIPLHLGAEDALVVPEKPVQLPALKTIHVYDSTNSRAPVRRGRGCKHGLWKPDHRANTFQATHGNCSPS